MAEVKYNKKHVFGENDFRVTTGDADYPERYFGLQHDTTNAVDLIGNGSKVTNHLDPIVLADNGYFDLPADSAGHGFFFLGDGDGYAEIIWDTSNTVTLITNTTNVNNTDIGGYFCFFDNTSSVRVKNRTGSSIRVIFEYEYTETIVAPTFKTFDIFSGVDNLDPNLTINGTTVTPTCRYKGGDASASGWDAWDYGETLSLTGTPVPTYNVGSPGLGENDDAVDFNAGGYFLDSSNTENQVSTGDLVFEVVWKTTSSSGLYLGGSRGAAYGFLSYVASGNRISFRMYDSGGNNYVVSGNLNVNDAWHHGICFVNRNEASTSGSQWYIDGVASGSGTDLSAISGDLSSTVFAIGDLPVGGSPLDSSIAYLAVWESTDWHQAGAAGPAEWSKIAAERFARFCGYWPEVATNSAELLVDGDMETAGTAAWSAVDSTLSKDTTAPLYEGTQHLRVTSTGSTFYAYQSILKTGVTYRVTGAARSVSGSAIPRVTDTTTERWLGTTSTSWQEFDVTFTAAGTGLYIGSASTHPGVVDFDDVSVTLLGYYPTANTRAFSAYLDKVEGDYRKLYYVGGEWLRMCHRVDSNAESVRGYLAETANENIFTTSEDFASGWALYDAGDTVNNNATVCPDGRVAAADFIPDSTDGRHELRKSVILTADTYSYSVFLKKGTATWINVYDSTSGQGAWFNLATLAIGTTAASTDSYIEGPFYGEFYRLCVVYPGTAATHTLLIRCTDADGGSSYSAGNGSDVAFSVWGAQVEQSDYMTSPVVTSGSTQTRLKDDLQFVAGDNIGGEDVGQGTLVADILVSTQVRTIGSSSVVAISDGGASTDRLNFYDYNGNFAGASTASGGDAGLSGTGISVVDNTKHSVRMTWETDNLIAYVDGVPDPTPDTTCDIPDGLDELDIGRNHASVDHYNGLISNLRIYSEPTLKG